MTIALLSGLIALARWIWDPMEPRSLPSFFADRTPFHIGSATVSWHQAMTMVIAIAVALALRVLLFNTRTGVEMRPPSTTVRSSDSPEQIRCGPTGLPGWQARCLPLSVGC